MIKLFTDWLLFSLLNLDPTTKLSESLHFFIYDSIKIIILLFLIVAIIGFLRSYISENKIKKFIKKRKYGSANLVASLFGALTPFCSCSSIPLFLSFLEVGVTLSFLITSPLVNEYVAVIMWAMFGWKVTVAYIITGILIGVIGGLVIGWLKLEHLIEKKICSCCGDSKCGPTKKKNTFKTLNSRIYFGIDEAVKITKQIWLWILIGVGLGAAMHGYIPEELISKVLETTGIFSVPLAVLIGIPLYANCAAIVPIAVVLFEKGFPIGTALAFMMASAALSLPEAVILKKIMKTKLIITFFTIVGISILVIGYLFNILGSFLI